MNLANKLTVSRIALTFIFMFFLFARIVPLAKVWALATFLLAAFTDLLDGQVARRRGEITRFGKLMDPVADKVLVLAAFLAFVEMGLIPAWTVLVIIGREMIITGLRIAGAVRGKVMAAEAAGKHKTISQYVVIITVLVFLAGKQAAEAAGWAWNAIWNEWFTAGLFYAMLVVIAFTLISGTLYVKRSL